MLTVYKKCFLTVYKKSNFVLVYVSQINILDSSATQWVFNLKSQSKSLRINFGILA